MNDRRPERNARPALHCLLSGIALAVAITTAGCVPTISMHSYHDVAVTITDADSGAPIGQTPLRVVYTYAPADSPFVYHVELRTPDEVRAETDPQGKAVVKLADYAWDTLLYVNHFGEDGFAGFILTKEAIRNGGVMQSYTRPPLKLELCPVTQPDHTKQVSSRAG